MILGISWYSRRRPTISHSVLGKKFPGVLVRRLVVCFVHLCIWLRTPFTIFCRRLRGPPSPPLWHRTDHFPSLNPLRIGSKGLVDQFVSLVFSSFFFIPLFKLLFTLLVSTTDIGSEKFCWHNPLVCSPDYAYYWRLDLRPISFRVTGWYRVDSFRVLLTLDQSWGTGNTLIMILLLPRVNCLLMSWQYLKWTMSTNVCPVVDIVSSV